MSLLNSRTATILRRIGWALLLCAVAGGCSGSGARSAATSPNAESGSLSRGAAKIPDVNADPCAIRLHESISPALLMYYALNYRMPAIPDELKNLPAYQKLDFTCPVSGKPYGYDPVGLPMPDGSGRIVVWDTTPVHGGIRWAIEITPAKNGGPPFANVVPIDQTTFEKIMSGK